MTYMRQFQVLSFRKYLIFPFDFRCDFCFFKIIMSGSKNNESDDPEHIIQTCQADARFINQNVTAWCFSTFVDHRRCQRLLGEKCDHCHLFEKIYKSICPNAWISRWEQQLQDGTFPVDLPEPRHK